MAKDSATTAGVLYINNNGGEVVAGSGGFRSRNYVSIGESKQVKMTYDATLEALCFIFS